MTGRSLRRALGSLATVGLLVIGGLSAVPAHAADPASTTPGLPTFYAKKVIGHSVQGRPIVAYHLGTPGAKTAVLLGQMHGNEHVGVRIAKAVLAGKPVKGVDLWVIPTMNPDGNAANTRQNAHGVDLNRNFPHHWARLRGRYYSGSSSLSEPESRAMYRFLRKVKPALMVSIHQPLDAVDSTDGGARNAAFRNRLARGLGLPVKALTCPGSGGCYGSMTSWLTATQKGSAITVEFPADPSAAMVQRAPGAILRAFGASRDRARAHNPVTTTPTITVSHATVSVAGRTHDPDTPKKELAVVVKEGSSVVASGRTSSHRYAFSFDAAPGRHTYCVKVTNRKWGGANPHVCHAVTVSEPSAPSSPPSQ